MVVALVTMESGCALVNRQMPKVCAQSVLVRVHAAAVCRTDLYVADRKIPTDEGRVIGHEGAGVIVEVGSEVSEELMGKRVVILPLRGCGECRSCLRGEECVDHRYMGIHYDGVFSEYVVVQEDEVFLIPDEVDYKTAAYLEPLAATLGVLDALTDSSLRVGVQGEGRISRLTLFLLAHHGYVNAMPFLSGEEYEVVIECANHKEAIVEAIKSLKPCGLLILKSRSFQPTELPQMEVIRKRIRIEAVYYAPFQSALDFLREHHGELSPFIGESFPLERYEEVFAKELHDESKKLYFQF